ncbi:MAG: radical SAM protein [Candidatus Aenigmarchaeota archaeon]|nr:radical SAM protein [Candidatus Aenigmarchaeota archaeon]
MVRSEIRLIVTDRCNLKCFYCYHNDKEAKGPFTDLYLNQVDAIAQIASDLNLPHIHLTGGEPTLRHDLDQVIKRLKNYGVKDVALTTNGTRLTEEYIKAMKTAGLNEMHVHLPSLNRDVYLRTTKCDLDPKKIADTVANASHQGFRFNTPVSGLNYEGIKDLLDYAYDNRIGVALIQIAPSRDYLGEYGIIGRDKIEDLLFEWVKSRGFKITQDPTYEDFGNSYNIDSKIQVQILPTSRTHDPGIDNRVWVGTDGEKYLFSFSLDENPVVTDSRGLKFLIRSKYALFKSYLNPQY